MDLNWFRPRLLPVVGLYQIPHLTQQQIDLVLRALRKEGASIAKARAKMADEFGIGEEVHTELDTLLDLMLGTVTDESFGKKVGGLLAMFTRMSADDAAQIDMAEAIDFAEARGRREGKRQAEREAAKAPVASANTTTEITGAPLSSTLHVSSHPVRNFAGDPRVDVLLWPEAREYIASLTDGQVEHYGPIGPWTVIDAPSDDHEDEVVVRFVRPRADGVEGVEEHAFKLEGDALAMGTLAQRIVAALNLAEEMRANAPAQPSAGFNGAGDVLTEAPPEDEATPPNGKRPRRGKAKAAASEDDPENARWLKASQERRRQREAEQAKLAKPARGASRKGPAATKSTRSTKSAKGKARR